MTLELRDYDLCVDIEVEDNDVFDYAFNNFYEFIEWVGMVKGKDTVKREFQEGFLILQREYFNEYNTEKVNDLIKDIDEGLAMAGRALSELDEELK